MCDPDVDLRDWPPRIIVSAKIPIFRDLRLLPTPPINFWLFGGIHVTHEVVETESPFVHLVTFLANMFTLRNRSNLAILAAYRSFIRTLAAWGASLPFTTASSDFCALLSVGADLDFVGSVMG